MLDESTQDLPFIQGNAEFGAKTPSPRLACNEAPKRAQAGAILLSVRAPVGALNIAPYTLGIGRGVSAVTAVPPHSQRFLWWCLHSLRPLMTSQAMGSTYPAIDAATVGALPTPTCEPLRQVQNADFLDRESDRIARLLDRLELLSLGTQEPLLSEFERSVYGWPYARIGYRYEVQLGKMLDEKRIRSGQLAPYLRNANVHWDRLVLDDLKYMGFDATDRRKFRLQPGDLLVCEGGEPGRAAVWDGSLVGCYYQKALHRVRPVGSDSTRFLLWSLRLLASGGAFRADGPGRYTHLTAEALRATRVRLPPPSVQQEIVGQLDAMGDRVRDTRALCGQMCARLAEYRDALITEAVTGQLDVTRLSDSQLNESAHAAVEGEQPEVLSA